jgi:hypothetical protein
MLFLSRPKIELLLTWTIGTIGIIFNLNLVSQAAAPLYTLDTKTHTLTIHNTGDASTQINSALNYLATRTDKSTPWIMKFDGGKYLLTKRIGADKLQNITLLSEPKNPAILVKDPSFANEYLFYTRFSQNITIKGFDFYGLSRVYNASNYTSDPTAPVWRDQGLYFGSSNGVIVNMNRFFSFGNAAIRITTTEADPVRGVNSFNSQVTQNYFNNVFQVTTTSNDLVHGGTSNYLFQGNTFDYLRGSVKFASRTPGATNVQIRHNSIRSSNTDGLEIVGYSNLEVSNNVFENITRNAINCYSNERASAGFQWGDNLIFKNNTINNTGGGFRISADATADGFQPVLNRVSFTDNQFSNLTGNAPAITLLNSSFPGLKILNNQFSNIPSKTYVYIPKKSNDITMNGNQADNKPLVFN